MHFRTTRPPPSAELRGPRFRGRAAAGGGRTECRLLRPPVTPDPRARFVSCLSIFFAADSAATFFFLLQVDLHTMRIRTWNDGYRRMEKRFERWCIEMTSAAVPWKDGQVEGHKIRYPDLLDADGEPRVDDVEAILLWASEQEDIKTLKDGVRWMDRYLLASLQMARAARKMPKLDDKVVHQWMEVDVAKRNNSRDRGKAGTAAGEERSKRADHLLTPEQHADLMHLAYSGDSRIHCDPLGALQTGVEVRITHMAGVRGELVRSAKFAHVWLHPYDELAGHKGIPGTTMYNASGDKTHEVMQFA